MPPPLRPAATPSRPGNPRSAAGGGGGVLGHHPAGRPCAGDNCSLHAALNSTGTPSINLLKVAVAHDDADLARPSSPIEAVVRASGREDQVQQFEYQVGGVSMSSNFETLEAYFNQMGAEGWELAHVFTGVGGRYLFKRPKPVAIDPPPPAPAY